MADIKDEGLTQEEIDARLERSHRQTQNGEATPFDAHVKKCHGEYRIGQPIETKVPRRNPVSIEDMTDAELEAKLMRAYQQALNGETWPFEDFAEEMRQKYGI